jgi:hypothetical protein
MNSTRTAHITDQNNEFIPFPKVKQRVQIPETIRHSHRLLLLSVPKRCLHTDDHRLLLVWSWITNHSLLSSVTNFCYCITLTVIKIVFTCGYYYYIYENNKLKVIIIIIIVCKCNADCCQYIAHLLHFVVQVFPRHPRICINHIYWSYTFTFQVLCYSSVLQRIHISTITTSALNTMYRSSLQFFEMVSKTKIILPIE